MKSLFRTRRDFFDSFGPLDEDVRILCEKSNKHKNDESQPDQDMEKNEKNKFEDFNLLFSGNTDDHFKFGLSVAKKSLNLFTEFYSSDLIIASPLGLYSVIGLEG